MGEQMSSKYISALRYKWLTPYYDVIVGLTTREKVFKKALINQLDIKSNDKILDLACGTGTLAIWIKQAHSNCEVIGVDADKDILSIARIKSSKNNVDINFKEAFSYNIPFVDSYFDCVVTSLFFHHLSWDDKVRTAKEIFRVLKPGGKIHVADWGRPENILMRFLFLFIQILDGFTNTQDNIKGRLINLFQESGYSKVSKRKSFSTMFGTMTLYSADKNK
jgi:ubiquinone/menaquinone biosynthesis C-methylase UbiE